MQRKTNRSTAIFFMAVFAALVINFSSAAQQFNAASPAGADNYQIGASFNNLNMTRTGHNYWHGSISLSWLLSDRNSITAGAGASLFTEAENYVRNLYLVYNRKMIRSGTFSLYIALGMAYHSVKITEIKAYSLYLLREMDEYSFFGVRPGLGVEFNLFNSLFLATELNYNMTFKPQIDHIGFGTGLKYSFSF